MNLEHIDPGDVIRETHDLYQKFRGTAETPPMHRNDLSRQVQALAYVLTEKVNQALLDIENASE